MQDISGVTNQTREGAMSLALGQESYLKSIAHPKAGGPLIADLFAGAGGLTEGFRNAGFIPAVAVEFDRWAARTYAANFGEHVLPCAIEDVSVTRESTDRLRWRGEVGGDAPIEFLSPEIDVLVGGPPCQGFSPLGRMNDWEYTDPRNKLWKHYVRVLSVLQPKIFVIENVPELLKSNEFEGLKRHVRRLAGGYDIAHGILNASHFGVPQNRKRAIIIGSRVGVPTLPLPSHQRQCVRDAIADLPSIPDGVNWHIARNPRATSVERYKCVPEGGNRFDLLRSRPDLTPHCWKRKRTGSVDVFGRMRWDQPSPTIRTEFFKPEKGRYLHPEAHRPITIREAARLQTFSDDFVFVGSNVQVAKQIGNAVPVQFAREIAHHVSKMLISDCHAEAVC
jgi:DNA (cytosine-5)-methyltransferase 1